MSIDITKLTMEEVTALKAQFKDLETKEAAARKAKMEVEQKEYVALLEVRKALAIKVHKVIKKLKVDGEKTLDVLLGEVKASGFSYTMDKEVGGVWTRFESVALTVSGAPKVARASGGNGGKRGRIKEMFEQYATVEEKIALDAAIANAKAKGATRVDGIEFKHRSDLEKRLIAAGTIQPKV